MLTSEDKKELAEWYGIKVFWDKNMEAWISEAERKLDDADMDYIYNMIEPCLHDIIIYEKIDKNEFIRRLKIIINNRLKSKYENN